MNVICSILIMVMFEGKEVKSNYTGRGMIVSQDHDSYIVDFSEDLKILNTADGFKSYRHVEVLKSACVKLN